MSAGVPSCPATAVVCQLVYLAVEMKPATAVVCQLVYLAVERAAQLTTEWREELTTTTAVMPAGHQHPARTAAEDHLTDTRTDRNTQEAGATR